MLYPHKTLPTSVAMIPTLEPTNSHQYYYINQINYGIVDTHMIYIYIYLSLSLIYIQYMYMYIYIFKNIIYLLYYICILLYIYIY